MRCWVRKELDDDAHVVAWYEDDQGCMYYLSSLDGMRQARGDLDTLRAALGTRMYYWELLGMVISSSLPERKGA